MPFVVDASVSVALVIGDEVSPAVDAVRCRTIARSIERREPSG